MGLADDLTGEVADIFRSAWDKRDGRVIPEPKDLKLSNDAIELYNATVMYADLDGSTKLVDSHTWEFAAEIYKTFLLCATKIVRLGGGTITSYDGDRVMGVFLGDEGCIQAVRCALKVNRAVQHIIIPAMREVYSYNAYDLRHVIGIDRSDIRAARTGARGDNDIVWVGRAPNYAAKLTSMDSNYQTWITESVYFNLNDNTLYAGDPHGAMMWTQWPWAAMGNIPVFGSTFIWDRI